MAQESNIEGKYCQNIILHEKKPTRFSVISNNAENAQKHKTLNIRLCHELFLLLFKLSVFLGLKT